MPIQVIWWTIVVEGAHQTVIVPDCGKSKATTKLRNVTLTVHDSRTLRYENSYITVIVLEYARNESWQFLLFHVVIYIRRIVCIHICSGKESSCHAKAAKSGKDNTSAFARIHERCYVK